MFRLDDKVAIVTGAARGLGRAIALALSAQGARVALVDVRLGELRIVSARCPGETRCYRVDVSKVPAIRRLVRAVARDFGGVDILVNNAGICPRLPFFDSTESDWDRLVSTNAKSQFFMMQTVAPLMKRRGGGRIINMASTGGRMGSFANASIYSGTKGAIVMFSKSIARELAADGILVNCVAPGMMDTDLMHNLPKARLRKFCESVPLRRLGRPAEVAAMVAFLASDECSYSTGATFDINGGWLMI